MKRARLVVEFDWDESRDQRDWTVELITDADTAAQTPALSERDQCTATLLAACRAICLGCKAGEVAYRSEGAWRHQDEGLCRATAIRNLPEGPKS